MFIRCQMVRVFLPYEKIKVKGFISFNIDSMRWASTYLESGAFNFTMNAFQRYMFLVEGSYGRFVFVSRHRRFLLKGGFLSMGKLKVTIMRY